jgi:hypothetical protein
LIAERSATLKDFPAMFLYWIPKTFDRAQIKQDIGYAFEGAEGEAIKKEVLAGPGGNGPGILVADRSWKSQMDRVKLDLENQYWRRVPKSLAWVGCDRGATLSPSDLQRSELVEGIGVELADGSVMQCAHARKFVEVEQQIVAYCDLPRTLEMDDDGKWKPTKIAKRFEKLSNLANEYSLAVTQAAIENGSVGPNGTVRFSFEQIDEFAISGLSANYRIGPAELALCNAYDVETRRRLVAAIMDEATYQLWSQKKTESDHVGSDSSSGQNASIAE